MEKGKIYYYYATRYEDMRMQIERGRKRKQEIMTSLYVYHFTMSLEYFNEIYVQREKESAVQYNRAAAAAAVTTHKTYCVELCNCAHHYCNNFDKLTEIISVRYKINTIVWIANKSDCTK